MPLSSPGCPSTAAWRRQDREPLLIPCTVRGESEGTGMLLGSMEEWPRSVVYKPSKFIFPRLKYQSTISNPTR
ncbi:hypothetical protein MHYP_G00172200 [Metynnis hypsauchen]